MGLGGDPKGSYAGAAEGRQMEDLGVILEELYSVGTVESSGEFTLNADVALEKMARFQLAEPHLYLLCLVASAVAGGAERFDLAVDADDVVARWDGGSFSRLELDSLFSNMLVRGRDARQRSLSELALGVRGALGSQPRWVSVESWNGETGSRLVIRGEERSLESLVEHGPAFTRVHVKERLALGRLVKKWTSGLPEAHLVERRCTYARMAVTVNGRLVSREPDLTGCLQRRKLKHGVLGLGRGGELGRAGESVVTVVLDGVSFPRPLNLGTGEVRAFLWTGELHKDLSQAGLVEDQAYLELVAELSRTVEEMTLELARRDRLDRSGPTRRRLAYHASRILCSTGRLREAHALPMPDVTPGVLRGRAAVAHRLGRLEEAGELLKQALALAEAELLRADLLESLAVVEAGPERRLEALRLRQLHELERKPHNVAENLELGAEMLLAFGGPLEEAERLLEQAQSLKQHLGEGHRRQASRLETLSAVRLAQGREEEAAELAQRALDIRTEAYGPGNPWLGMSLAPLALARRSQELARRRLAIVERVYGPHHPEVAASLNLLGLLEGGEAHLPRAQAILVATLGPEHPDSTATTARLGGDEDARVVIDYRGWFHRRARRRCSLPLTSPRTSDRKWEAT